jgi:Raf kinase inhibitor-like YbhB/YbcL family protein
MRLSSPAFEHGGRMPDAHTRAGENLPPPLAWSGMPEGTRELALLCTDADAPVPQGATHWVRYGIDAGSTGTAAGERGQCSIGVTSSGVPDWTGPNPPPGHGTHHYFFWLYALDEALGLPGGLSQAELLTAMSAHVLGQQRLVGTFSRD